MNTTNTTRSLLIYLWAILFIEGLVSVSLQIIFIRQLTPFVGNDVTVVGIVIGTYLTALSWGYYKGGKHGGDLYKLSSNFLFSALWSGIFMSYWAMSLWFDRAGFLEVNYLKMTVYLMVGLFPVVYWLGHTVPLLVGMMKNATASELAGKSLAINTIGSVFGAVITPIVFFSLLGVSATIVLYMGMLCALYILTLYIANKLTIYRAAVAPLLLLIVYWANVTHTNDIFIKTTTYANYDVRQGTDEFGNHHAILSLNETAASVIMNSQNTGYIRYSYNFMKEQLGLVDHDVLVLGSGGFTFSMNDKTSNRYTYIDIDPKIKDIAERFFLNFNIKGDFIAKDARNYVAQTENTYDMIFVDLYSHNVNMPWHVTTQEFVQGVSDALNKDGYAMFNAIEEMGFKHPDNRRLHNTIKSVFNYCYVVPLYNEYDVYANVIYICKKNDGSMPEINIDNRQR